MNPIFSTQIIARVTLWSFVFMTEVLIAYSINEWHHSVGHYAIFISGAMLVLLATIRLGNSDLVADLRDLYLYQNSLNQHIYFSLTYSVLALKFLRLLWPIEVNNANGLISWPIFGPFGYWHAKTSHTLPMKSFTLDRRGKIPYLAMLLCFPLIHLYRSLGGKTPMAFWAVIGVAIIFVYFQRFMTYLDRREAQHVSNERKAAAAKATEEQNAILAAKNIELAQANFQLAASHQELAAANEIKEEQNRALQASNTQLALAKAAAEQSEKEKQAALEQVNRLNAALCDASHDLRRPMAGVNRRVAELLQSIDKPEEVREAAVTELNNAMRFLYKSLDSTIHDGMLATGLAQPEIRAVAVLQMFDELFADWMQEAMRKGFDYIRCYPKGVFPPPVATDKALLWRILHNLVINGITHGGQGTKLVMSIRAHGQLATIRVWDTGPGIEGLEGRDMAANFLNLLARPRQKKHERTNDGHGLGLHIVWKLTQILGVTIGVRSRLGIGTLFRFDLPLADEALIIATKQADQREAALLAKVGMDAQSSFRGSVLWPNLLD